MKLPFCQEPQEEQSNGNSGWKDSWDKEWGDEDANDSGNVSVRFIIHLAQFAPITCCTIPIICRITYFGSPEGEKDETPDLVESVRQRVEMLNRSGKLCSEIDLGKVGKGLAQLSEPIALQLLKVSQLHLRFGLVVCPSGLYTLASS